MAMNDDYYIQLPSKHRIFSYLPAVAIGNLYIYIHNILYHTGAYVSVYRYNNIQNNCSYNLF